MHVSEIRDNCHPCGHRERHPVVGSFYPVDYCGFHRKPCADVEICDPKVRRPRVKRVYIKSKRRKR